MPDGSSQVLEIVAVADGFGPAWFQGEVKNGNELTLRLVADHQVHGRVVDLQGKPVAGARVTVNAVGLTENNDAGPLVQSLKERQSGTPRRAATQAPTTRVGTSLAPQIYRVVVSDDDGRFALTGLGRERFAEVIVEFPLIVSEMFQVIARAEVSAIQVPKVEKRPEHGKVTWYGADFIHVAEPCRPVVGSVRDAQTGQPLAGVRVAGVESIALAEVAPNADNEVIRLDLELDSGTAVAGRVLDADGNELSSAVVRGLTPVDSWNIDPLTTASFTVTGLRPDERRTLLFIHDAAATATTTHDSLWILPSSSNRHGKRPPWVVASCRSSRRWPPASSGLSTHRARFRCGQA